MLVQFESSETAEVLMFAETARSLLQAIGKATTARGTFTQPEMLPAAEALRRAVAQAEAAAAPEDEEDEEGKKRKEPVVVLRQRAWPLIDMLERTSRAGPEAHITWVAKADF